MSTTKKRKRNAHPCNNNARQHGIYATPLDTAAAQSVHCYEAKTPLAPILLCLQTALRRYNAIVRRRSKPAGTNQAKTPESTKTLPERIEAKTAPSPPAPASEEDKKMKSFFPVFNETNQPRLYREQLLHDVQDDSHNQVCHPELNKEALLSMASW